MALYIAHIDSKNGHSYSLHKTEEEARGAAVTFARKNWPNRADPTDMDHEGLDDEAIFEAFYDPDDVHGFHKEEFFHLGTVEVPA